MMSIFSNGSFKIVIAIEKVNHIFFDMIKKISLNWTLDHSKQKNVLTRWEFASKPSNG